MNNQKFQSKFLVGLGLRSRWISKFGHIRLSQHGPKFGCIRRSRPCMKFDHIRPNSVEWVTVELVLAQI